MLVRGKMSLKGGRGIQEGAITDHDEKAQDDMHPCVFGGIIEAATHSAPRSIGSTKGVACGRYGSSHHLA